MKDAARKSCWLSDVSTLTPEFRAVDLTPCLSSVYRCNQSPAMLLTSGPVQAPFPEKACLYLHGQPTSMLSN